MIEKGLMFLHRWLLVVRGSRLFAAGILITTRVGSFLFLSATVTLLNKGGVPLETTQTLVFKKKKNI
jgi:hypothetical protein